MAHIDRYTCDECGAEKGAANGWYQILIQAGTLLRLYHWENGQIQPQDGSVHLCGQKCVLARVDKFMSSGKGDANG